MDINGLDELSYIRQEGEHLHIGALTRQYRLERDARIRQTVPVLAAATRLIGHPPIRYAGTIGGSLAHADPAAELPAVMCALEAELIGTGPSGVRSIQAADFFQGALAADLRPDELLTEVRIPIRQNVVWGMREYTRRAGDFALAGAIVLAPRGRRTVGRTAESSCLGWKIGRSGSRRLKPCWHSRRWLTIRPMRSQQRRSPGSTVTPTCTPPPGIGSISPG